MAGSNNFQEFNPSMTNTESDANYLADTTRLGGLSAGVASTLLHNKLFRQFSVMSAALGQFIANTNNNASDASLANLSTALKAAIASKNDLNTWGMNKPVADTGAANNYVISSGYSYSALYSGMIIKFTAANANTGASTVNVDSLGTKAIVKGASTALASGDITVNQTVTAIYDGTNFQIIPDYSSALVTLSSAFSAHVTDNANSFTGIGNKFTDIEYQTPTIAGTQIQLIRHGSSKRLFFYLSADISGNITISLDGGATSAPLKDYDGIQLTSLSKGYQEVVDNTTFFTYAPKNGASGMSKIYKGTTTPSSPQESDIWVKDDTINIATTIFDKDFSTGNSYATNSLVFYFTSNPADQGYKILVDLFGRTNKIDMKVPLFCAAFWNGTVWVYPLVYVYVSGVWTYLSGALLDSNSRMTALGSINSSTYKIAVQRYDLAGTQDITDKLVTTTPALYNAQSILASVELPIDGRKFVVGQNDVGGTANIYVLDKDGNLTATVNKNSLSLMIGTSNRFMLADDTYVYWFAENGTSAYISKIAIATNTMVASVSLSVSATYWNGNPSQSANYLWCGIYQIKKSDLSMTAMSAATYFATCTDKTGRILNAKAVSTTTFTIDIVNADTKAIIKSVTLTLPYTLNGSTTIWNIQLDKDDNLFVWTSIVTTGYQHLTKYTRDTTNDTWVYFADYGNTYLASSSNAKVIETDLYGNVYTSLADQAGVGILKLNPNMQNVFTKTTLGSNSVSYLKLNVDPCSIKTDYLRTYFK